MAAESVVETSGRIEYIEPNDLFIRSEGDKIRNGIAQPYEDYSFSVNLRVFRGNRYDCGLTSDGEDITSRILEFSSDKGTISFIGGTASDGTPGYLTTNFTDISMNDPSTNTKECLGIESITISYNSWYTPTVDIRFVDVRGASLMQPSEYEYYNNGAPRAGKEYHKSNSDFFKAFFSFPYPMFKLSVKGFYGKEVTYDLSVVSSNIEFNASTGNFEIAANFIGYMYGLYADLPFPFIYLAPYIDPYGMNTWEEKKKEDFRYLTVNEDDKADGGNREIMKGEAMYTFPEFKSLVKTVEQTADKEMPNSKEGKERAALDTLKKILTESLKHPTESPWVWGKWSKYNIKTNRSGYFFISADNTAETRRKIFDSFITYYKYLSDYNEAAGSSATTSDLTIDTSLIFKEIYGASQRVTLKNASSTKNDNANPTVTVAGTGYTDEQIEEVLNGKIVALSFYKDAQNKENPSLIFDKSNSSLGVGVTSEEEYADLIRELQSRFNDPKVPSPMKATSEQTKWTIFAFRVGDIEYKNDFSNKLNTINERLAKLDEKIRKNRDVFIQESLGMQPTMRNLYNMIFAHIDTFMTVFYNTLDSIRKKIESDDVSRVYENLCGKDGSKVEVDVNENTLSSPFTHGRKLPPFTMFYKEETEKDSKDRKTTAIWPGDLNGGENLDEVKLVEAIINATALNKKRFEPVTPLHNKIKQDGILVPTNYYDVVSTGWNPYLEVINTENFENAETLNQVIETFIYRCYYGLLGGGYVAPLKEGDNDGLKTNVISLSEKAKLIAEIETENVIRAFERVGGTGVIPGNNFTTALMATTTEGLNIINAYVRDGNKRFVSVGDNLSYQGIKKSDSYCLPVGMFNPVTLSKISADKGTLKGNVGKFLKIKSKETTGTTYSCHLYTGGRYIENRFAKNGQGTLMKATRLFPNYDKVPDRISGVTFYENTFINGPTPTINDLYLDKSTASTTKAFPQLPSARITKNGVTSIFMDPLYYAQETPEARAYLFLMGIPLGKDKKYYLPEKIENGDYPTILLLREGAVYWRNDYIRGMSNEDGIIQDFTNDPIKYEYVKNGVTQKVLDDIEKYDPCLGRRYAFEYYQQIPENVSESRRQLLIDYFLKWAAGVINPEARPGAVTADTNDNVEVPSPSLDFPTIERFLALQEHAGNVNKVLSPGSAELAITGEVASVFGNSNILRSVYGVDSNDHLGKTGLIRSNVFIQDPMATLNGSLTRTENGSMSADIEVFLTRFKAFYLGFDTIIDFSCLDNPNAGLTVPKTAMSDGVSTFIKKLKDTYGVSTEKIKENTGATSTGIAEDKYHAPEYFKDKDLKLACYIALKNLYDRWLCSRRRECWNFSCDPSRMRTSGIRSDFMRFFYLDEFYHNIGMQIRPDVNKFIEMTSSEGGFTDRSDDRNLASSSILKVLSTTAQYGGCALLTLPTMLGLGRTYATKDERFSIEDVFKAFPYNEAVKTDDVESCFIVLYSNQKSTFLPVNSEDGSMGYKDDGFDIANTWGKIVPQAQAMFSDVDGTGLVVPCFGVTFAQQNQAYFKNVSLSMDNHQLTEYAIRNTVMISYANNKGPTETNILGQDLYNVYANYSYSCTVDMMGDSQITPLMYFQLNNIPMWKGAYLITTVKHNINVEGMTTTFTGVRQARPSIPFKGEKLILPATDQEGNTAQSQDDLTTGEDIATAPSTSPKPLDLIDIDTVDSVTILLTRSSYDANKGMINGLLDVVVRYKGGATPEVYSNYAQTIELTTGLTGDLVNYELDKDSGLFSIPYGKYTNVSVSNLSKKEEYREDGDAFYEFTDKKHIMISEAQLKGARLFQKGRACEIVTGETLETLNELDPTKISAGGTFPIMLYSYDGADLSKKYNADEIRGVYQSLFKFIRRAIEANVPTNLLIMENDEVKKYEDE